MLQLDRDHDEAGYSLLGRVKDVSSQIARLVNEGSESNSSLLVVLGVVGIGSGLLSSHSHDALGVSEAVGSHGGSLVEKGLLSNSSVGSVAGLVREGFRHGLSVQEVSSRRRHRSQAAFHLLGSRH